MSSLVDFAGPGALAVSTRAIALGAGAGVRVRARHTLAWPRRALVACATGLAVASPVAADCGAAPTLGALAGAERSQWEEWSSQGRSLLREQGTLTTLALELAGRCRTVDWSARWTLGQGQRDYDGRTNTGAPLQTHSRLQTQHLALQGWAPVHPNWFVGVQLGYRHIERDIASQGSVLGYPERFGYWQAALGARYQVALGQRLQLAVSGWAGGGPGGRMRVDLPRADPATLVLGASRLLAWEVALHSPQADPGQPGWSWQLGLGYRHERTGASRSTALVRNGLPAGSALQPRTVQRHWGALAGATYHF